MSSYRDRMISAEMSTMMVHSRRSLFWCCMSSSTYLHAVIRQPGRTALSAARGPGSHLKFSCMRFSCRQIQREWCWAAGQQGSCSASAHLGLEILIPLLHLQVVSELLKDLGTPSDSAAAVVATGSACKLPAQHTMQVLHTARADLVAVSVPPGRIEAL